MDFEIVPNEKAKVLRESFIQNFINTTSGHYKKHIAALIHYTDGMFYDGYLWECLQDNDNYQKECKMETAAEFLKNKKSVFVMWDLFSKERILDHRRFSLEYPKDIVISMHGNLLGQKIEEEWNNELAAWADGCQCQDLWLPEDIYCFDESMDWYAIFTHEGRDHWTNPELDEDSYIRICFLNANA